MDDEVFRKIKKKNAGCLGELSRQYLKRAWFICWHTTRSSQRAVPLLLNCWNKTISKISARKSPPKESFMALLSVEILQTYRLEIFREEAYAEIPPPSLGQNFQVYSDCLSLLEEAPRAAWLVYAFGELGNYGIAAALGITPEEAKEQIDDASSALTNLIKKRKKYSGTQMITLSTKFRNPDGSGLSAVTVPVAVQNALSHMYRKYENKESPKRKESVLMNEERTKKKRNAKIRKWIMTLCILGAIAVGAIIGVPKLAKAIKGEDAAPTTITTYQAEAITHGDVDTTISGSGTLTPIKSDTLTVPYSESEEDTTAQTEASPNGAGTAAVTTNTNTVQTETYEVTEWNVAAGSTFAEGDVLGVLTDEDGATTQMTAEYDGVMLEVLAEVGDEMTSGTEVAVLMSKDGFELSISVDELDIATVASGQEVTVSVDALSAEYIGTVSAISYNGTVSGSTTSYQLTAQIDYAEGLYPAMNADAEIVTESSGEGLLVPVDAVQTSGDDSYVYLAPDGAESGTEYDEDELTLSELTKVTVETGMSDGSYILIESDQLAEGDLILLTKVTSTLTGSETEEENGGFGGGMRGGFGGGEMPEGMEGGFDPGNMPQGGNAPDFGNMQ